MPDVRHPFSILMGHSFFWSDAWLLLAVVYAGHQAHSDLATIVACGDALEHAVFTHHEFSGGVRRLVNAGLVTFSAGTLKPTPAGLALVPSALPGAPDASVRSAVEDALGAALYPSQGPPEPIPFVPVATFDAAVRSYLSGHHSQRHAGA